MSESNIKVRWAIIGCGDIANKRVAPAINDSPTGELAAVVRRNREKCQDFAARHGAPKCYTNFAAAIADDDVDAVYVATPVDLHAPQSIAAAYAGKHVLVEKPMALSVGECDDIVAACRESNVRLGVAYYRRYYEIVRAMRELINDGALGEVRFARVFVAERFHIAPEADGYWRVDPEQSGGGPLQDIGSHRLDLLLSLFGPVAEVSASCGASALGLLVEDHAWLTLKFASGVEAVLSCAWHLATSRDEWEIYGSKGSITVPRLNGDCFILERDGVREERKAKVDSNIHYPLIADFEAAVLQGRPPRVTGEEGREVTRVILAAYEAAARGVAVRLA